MKYVMICIYLISHSLSAQVGRYEEPVDTIAIGGEIQEHKSAQMESQDLLREQLSAIRDSVDIIRPQSRAEERKREVDQIIVGLKKTDRSPALMKKGYALLNDIRSELKSGRGTDN
jgi:hypothetical protein